VRDLAFGMEEGQPLHHPIEATSPAGCRRIRHVEQGREVRKALSIADAGEGVTGLIAQSDVGLGGAKPTAQLRNGVRSAQIAQETQDPGHARVRA
jgi:hypothetical protein